MSVLFGMDASSALSAFLRMLKVLIGRLMLSPSGKMDANGSLFPCSDSCLLTVSSSSLRLALRCLTSSIRISLSLSLEFLLLLLLLLLLSSVITLANPIGIYIMPSRTKLMTFGIYFWAVCWRYLEDSKWKLLFFKFVCLQKSTRFATNVSRSLWLQLLYYSRNIQNNRNNSNDCIIVICDVNTRSLPL